jgi:hypothetical protein
MSNSILLPQPRLPQTATPKLIDFGVDLTPPGGGPSQRVNRIGNRFSLVIVYPRLRPEPDGRILMSALRQAKTMGALFPFPEPGIPAVDYGTPVVNGAGQQGSSLSISGLTPGMAVVDGKFFSIIFAGQRYLHHTTADVVVAGDGIAEIPICPMLRISPNDAAVCEFAQPYIEGALSGNSVDVELAIAKATPASITITERA